MAITKQDPRGFQQLSIDICCSRPGCAKWHMSVEGTDGRTDGRTDTRLLDYTKQMMQNIVKY